MEPLDEGRVRPRPCAVRSRLGELCGLALITAAVGCEPGVVTSHAPLAPELAPIGRPCQTHGDPSHRARYCMAQARARMASYPFAPDRGPQALTWLSEAAACYADAAQPDGQTHAEQVQARFRARLESDFRVARLRLEHALTDPRSDERKRTTRFLLALLSGQPETAYARWLERVQRSQR